MNTDIDKVVKDVDLK